MLVIAGLDPAIHHSILCRTGYTSLRAALAVHCTSASQAIWCAVYMNTGKDSFLGLQRNTASNRLSTLSNMTRRLQLSKEKRILSTGRANGKSI